MLKNTVILLFISFILIACKTAETRQQSKKSYDFPTGDISVAELKSNDKFFSHHHHKFTQAEIDALKSIETPITITSYFGLWCHDSQREIPQLLDLLEAANNENITHKMIALDVTKKEPENRQEADNVLFTPTIIVKIDGKEVGRIIEKPKVSLVEDIKEILYKQYKAKIIQPHLPITSHPSI